MKFLKMNKSSGFTLIEVLVAIFIVGLLSAILITSLRKNEKQYQLKISVQKIVQDIRKAQNFALSGKKRYWPPTGRMIVPESYGIHFDKGNPRFYFIYGDYIGNDGYQPPEDLAETNTWIEEGIEIDSLGGNILDGFFFFSDGFTGFFPSAPGGVATIVIKRTGKTCPSRYWKNIIIKNTGEISIQ